MKCFACGQAVPDATRFCGHCGTKLADPHDQTVTFSPEEGDELLRRVRSIFSGEYTIEREVGRGGMAVVFQATEIALHRVVALKVLPPEVGITPKAAERFKREARLVADLEHPNIIPVYRAGQIGGLLHIAMKYVDGVTLEHLLERHGPLPVPVVLGVLRDATRALAYAHERDIVHRDVKSANILVDRDGRIHMSDFGVALRASDVTLTQAGMIIGTPAFMSPEQCAGRRALPQSDQYSIGILAFQMLAGAVPFSAETLAGLMQHHFFTLHPDLHAVRDDVPLALVEWVNRALRKDPAERFPTTRDMLAALGAIRFGEEERRASDDLLRAAVRGESITRVVTRELPALPEQPTLLTAAAAPRPRPGRTPSRVRVAAAALGLMLGGGALMLWLNRAEREVAVSRESRVLPPPASAQSSPPPAQAGTLVAPRPLPAARPGSIRILTQPADAAIYVDGRRAGVGSLYDYQVESGSRRIDVRAPGYQSFDSVLVVRSGERYNLRLVALLPEDDST
jgi:hypothetical protein